MRRDVLKQREKTVRKAIMGLIVSAMAAVGSFLTSVMNFITDPFLTPPVKATLSHLEEAELKTLQGGECLLMIKYIYICIIHFYDIFTHVENC